MYTLIINNIKNNKKIMRILAIDVGTGTQDIMIYDTEKELENSIKLVLPSPHLFISQQIRDIENDIYFEGEIMGGGKIKKSIIEHIEIVEGIGGTELDSLDLLKVDKESLLLLGICSAVLDTAEYIL